MIYSIRGSKSGEVFLAAVRISNEETSMYNLDRIIQAMIINQTFKARYEIELATDLLIPLKSISRKK